MKKLAIVLFVLLFASTAGAWNVNWDAAPNAEGYLMSYSSVSSPSYITTLDIGSALTCNLDNLGLVEGTRYEFWINAYASGSTGGDSDHIRWTYPQEPIVIEMMGNPVNIVIKP